MMWVLARTASNFTRGNNSHSDIFPPERRSSIISYTSQGTHCTTELPFKVSCATRMVEVLGPVSRICCLVVVDHKKNSKLSFTVWAVRKSRRPSWIRTTQPCAFTLFLSTRTTLS